MCFGIYDKENVKILDKKVSGKITVHTHDPLSVLLFLSLFSFIFEGTLTKSFTFTHRLYCPLTPVP